MKKLYCDSCGEELMPPTFELTDTHNLFCETCFNRLSEEQLENALDRGFGGRCEMCGKKLEDNGNMLWGKTMCNACLLKNISNMRHYHNILPKKEDIRQPQLLPEELKDYERAWGDCGEACEYGGYVKDLEDLKDLKDLDEFIPF